MFAKVSLESFVYDLTETFFFPNKKIKEIYNKYITKRIFPYSILRVTDTICVFFIFICKPESCISDSQFRDVLFEVIINNDVLHRFDTSHKFWEKYSVKNESLGKKLGCFLIENLDDPFIVNIAVNPKEYFEELESQFVKKKHKGLR